MYGAAPRMFSKAFPGIEPESLRKTTRKLTNRSQLQTPGSRAQRASKGLPRSTTLAILMLALLSPRWLGCASWCFALVLLAIVCASLLVFSVACDACGSRFSRASRSSIARLWKLMKIKEVSFVINHHINANSWEVVRNLHRCKRILNSPGL